MTTRKPVKKKTQVIPVNMPKGKSTKSRQKRRAMIDESLKPLQRQGVKTKNKDTGWNVKVTSDSIRETRWHASADNISTMAACNIRKQIKRANYVSKRKLKGNHRETDMKLTAKHEFKGKQGLADTRLMIGEIQGGEKVLYSITKKKGKKKRGNAVNRAKTTRRHRP